MSLKAFPAPRSLLVAAGSVALPLAYLRLVRPWYRHWGASPQEVAAVMPLDDRITDPDAVSTRAVTIHAPPEEVWKWVVQMGEPPRAGFYSYTWIERAQGLRIRNAAMILPEFQQLHPGDSLDAAGNMRVIDVDPGHWLALGPPELDWMESTWVLALYPHGAGATRLVARLRARMSPAGMLKALPPWVWPFWLLIDPGVFIMERKMLLTIKQLAEKRSASAATADAVRGG